MERNNYNIAEYQAIQEILKHYVKGAVNGSGSDMKPAFHRDATIFGYVGADLFAGPIQGLFDWADAQGPSPKLAYSITNVDILESVASVRVESDNWNGLRFTDYFNLLKIDAQWYIMNKVFYLHTKI